MIRMRLAGVCLVLAALFLSISLAPARAQTTAAPTGFRAEFLADWDDFAKKVVSLAEAMPAEKFTWRPGAQVRSVSEIYMHIAGGNFTIPRATGVQPPEGIDVRGLDKITDKEKVVAILRQSCEHVRAAILKTPDSDLDKVVKLYGQDTTVRGAFYVLGTHQHEHFGLAIAYARANGIVPPWTAARQAQQHDHEAQKAKP
ncbi:MAG TPA: DinB family protein [Bryobacteraceae bacterium]|nr:DinB family protein [Bryobacteraceae bacterium]